jgi:hypothetical protein
MAGTISSLNIKIGANISEALSGLQKIGKETEQLGRKMSDLGKTLSTRVTAPIVAMGALSVRAFGIQEKAELQLRAALQANGREVDKLFGRYNAFAQEMQRVTVVGDETTLAMLAQAESFGLSADSAERAVKNSIAMQSAFGVNAQSALRYTAALESGNATMLTRYIPSLRDITDESEKVAEAQRILGNAFSSAEAEAQGSAGQITQLRNAVGDLSEQFGAIIADRILPFVNRLKKLAIQFQGLNTIQKEQIVVLGSIAAGIGPVLFGLGKITLAVRSLTTAMLANPYLAVAAGILAISTHVLLANRRLSRMGDLVREALDMPVTGTREELDKLTEAITFQEELIGRTIAQHESMGVVGSEASEKQLQPMRDVLDALIDQRDEVAKLQLDNKIASDQNIEGLNAQEQAYNDVRGAVERIKVLMDEPLPSIFDPTDVVIARMLNEEFREFEDILYQVATASFDFRHRLDDVTEKGNDARVSLGQFGMVATQAFDRLVFTGEKLSSVLSSIARQFASKSLMTGLQMLLGGGGLSAIGGFGGFFKKVIGVNDAMITSSGQVVKFHPDDNILAMKDFSKLGSGGSQHVTVSGKIRGETIYLSNSRGGNRFER